MERAQLKAVLQASGVADECGGVVVLRDPHWTAGERGEVERLKSVIRREKNTAVDEGWLCVRTGGSSGTIKFARHDESTFGAAVRGFCAHFGVERVNAIGVLPLHHVSGLMAA